LQIYKKNGEDIKKVLRNHKIDDDKDIVYGGV